MQITIAKYLSYKNLNNSFYNSTNIPGSFQYGTWASIRDKRMINCFFGSKTIIKTWQCNNMYVFQKKKIGNKNQLMGNITH